MLDIENLKLPNGKVINLSIAAGEVIVMSGANGTGKSLLLKCVASLLPAESQSFKFQGKDLRDWDYREYRSLVTYSASLPHAPMDQTVEQFLESPWKLKIHQHKAPDSFIDSEAYLKRFGLQNLSLTHLSSGQRQLLSLLRLVNLGPKILLLDEVMSHLDKDKTREMEQLLLEWKLKTGGTLLLISHDEQQSLRMNAKTVDFDSLLVPDRAVSV